MSDFGIRLRARRDALGLTLKAVAERAGCSESELSLIERGRHRPKFETAMAIADALGVTAEEMYRAPQEEPERTARGGDPSGRTSVTA